MVDNHYQSDIVDEAFDALRRSQTHEGPSSQAMEQTLHAVRQARLKSNRISLVERIRNMNKLIKYPVAAAMVLAALVGGAYLLVNRSVSIAFADVRQGIEKTRTMTLTASVEMKGMKKPMIMKMFFKSPGLMRQEMTWNMEAFMQLLRSQAGTTRPFTAPTDVKAITIFDLVDQKGISLIPSQKKAIIIEVKNLPAEQIAQAKEQNMLDKLKKAVAGEHQDLGEKTIDGRKCKGYRCKSEEMQQMTMDIWVDASTGTPLLVEEILPEAFGGGKVTMTDFVIDPKLDDSLFDTKAPEGYSVENQVVDLEITEEELVKCMGIFAKHLGGVFPNSLMLTPELVKQIKDAEAKEKKARTPDEKKARDAEEKEFVKLYQKTILLQIRTTQEGGEFVYAGRGVKLGDKATPILWYKAKDAKTYRVIYGDLHAEDVETAPNPPASRPAPSAGLGQAPSGASTQPR